MVRQMMLGLRAAGAEVFEFNTDLHPEALDCDGREYDRGTFGPVWLRWEILGPQIEWFHPELIVCNAGGLSFRAEDARALRKSVALLGIALSDPDVFEPATSRIARNFDLFLTSASACIPAYRATGATVDVLPLATNEEFFHPVPSTQIYACEVLVIGRAHADRIDPVRRLSCLFDVHIHGEGWEEHGLPSRGTLYGEELLTALNSAKIAVIFSRTRAGHPIGKVAIFDFIGGGALVATDSIPEIAKCFDFDRELIGFSSTDELIAKIRFYLANPGLAAQVRESGRKRVLSEHLWRHVWPRIIGNIQSLKKRAACGASAQV